ncbi:hypothetical protein RND71_009494 [Anisodus tanguticus]|uniref:Uncharacterized protein n=1 Tax=Anisodus tanguticus TaxID=243964 RepID=A0AAE1SFY0_9SOLA|nr:hypothetical protein RND71_009494 [Anisodus tanguticus]
MEEVGMLFKDMEEGRQVVNYYALANKMALRISKADTCMVVRRGVPLANVATLAQYFKNKLQNNPKYKLKDIRGELEFDFRLNVSQSKLKRAKNMILEKLEGSFVDDYNKLEAYGQEIRQSN